MRLPSLPHVDWFSFWLGFAAAALVAYLLYQFRQPIRGAQAEVDKRLRKWRERFTSGIERQFREDTLRYAQTAHLAGALFALDDILLPPRLLIPEQPVDPTPAADEDDPASIIPVLPDWPEMAGTYQAPSRSVEAIFSGQHNLLVLGAPGAGKTSLLAHLATRAAQSDASLFTEGLTPIFIHAGDLELPRAEKDDVVQPLIAAAVARATTLTAARLPQHLRLRLKSFQCLILLDGLDEAPPAKVEQVAAWLAEFRKAYPHQRLIVAAGPWGYGPLLNAGLAPVWLAPWSPADYQALFARWCTAWENIIVAGRRRKVSAADVDLNILRGWLIHNNRGRTIFEITLKVWAALAGDSRGARPVDWLEAYFLRHNVASTRHPAVFRLALAMLNESEALGLPRAQAAKICDSLLTNADGKREIDSDDFLDDLVNRKVLSKRAGGRLAFRHSLALAYYAAKALAAAPETQTGDSPAWVRALYFLGPLGDLTPIVSRSLTQAPDVMQTDLLTATLWLREVPAGARWRGEVFKRLARVLFDARQPESLRLRALAGFIAAGDPSLTTLFTQALTQPDPLSRRMGALGLGALAEGSAVPVVKALFGDDYLDVRWAAALALAAIGTEAAGDALVEGLLHGDDNLRRACAQALARNPEFGHAMLKEAIKHEDLGVRRAAIYGLADVGAAWARELLEQTQANEQQWIVRSAATEAIDHMKTPDYKTPQPVQAPEAQGWLVAWAASKGTGVPPGKAAVEILARALKEGEDPIRSAAAEALGRLGDPAAARELYAGLKDASPLVRDAAFRALARISQASAQRLAASA